MTMEEDYELESGQFQHNDITVIMTSPDVIATTVQCLRKFNAHHFWATFSAIVYIT